MTSEKYIGLDVHQATISVAVMDASGKLVMESILESKASTLLQFLAGLRGNLSVTFEEGTWAAWLYDVLKPHVAHLVVCNPRKNALLKAGSKSDRIDARKLAELLRGNHLKPVYHGETGVRMLRELARSYLTMVEDQIRVMNRLKALYRSWAIGCAGRDVYYIRHRAEWLAKLREPGVRRRAERLYEQLDEMQRLRRLARHDLLVESRKHCISSKLRQIPYVGPIRAALLIALLQTPHRFRTKRQLWAYSGLALETHTSAEYGYNQGQLQRSKKLVSIRGLNKNHDHDLKGLFKATATMASMRRTVPRVLPGIAGQRHEASHGSSHAGAQDCGDYADTLEEGRKLRRRETKTASSLSVSAQDPQPLRRNFRMMASGSERRSGSRASMTLACRHGASGTQSL
jgi:transposase